MATIIDGKKRIPFLRGMLAHYLIEQGFAFQDAYGVADRVRRSLQKAKEISAKDMADLVCTHSKKQFGERAVGDGVFWEPRSRQLIVEDGQSQMLFSLEHLADSLTAIGLDHDLAHRIAQLVQQEILAQGHKSVKRNDVFKSAQKVIKRECGADYAERYDAWYRFRNDTRHHPLIVLIGGASGVGKTSVGVALANHLKISRVVSTDAIRQIMRLMISEELMPTLHVSSYEAWKQTGAALPDQGNRVVQAFREQALRVCVGVRAMIDRAIDENTSMVIDGVHLLPDLIDLKGYENKAIFVWVNFSIDDEKHFAERFRIRGEQSLQRTPHKYIDNLKAILEIQKHILEIGEKNHVFTVENSNFEETVQSVSQHIMDVFRKVYKN